MAIDYTSESWQASHKFVLLFITGGMAREYGEVYTHIPIRKLKKYMNTSRGIRNTIFKLKKKKNTKGKVNIIPKILTDTLP